jgi:hypothetical protein
MVRLSGHLVDRVLPFVPVRQFCVTREIIDFCAPFVADPEYCGVREPERPICLFPAVIPDWMAASARATTRSSAGRCVSADACSALQSAQPGVWRCIAPGGGEL